MWFEYNGAGWSLGDTIPEYLVGKKVTVQVHLAETDRYYFDYDDAEAYWSSTQCNVSLNGTDIPSERVFVSAGKKGATLSFSYETTIKEAFTGNISVTGETAITTGKTIPELKADNGFTVSDMWFEYNGAGWSLGDTIPEYLVGKKVTVQVRLGEADQYYFGYNEKDTSYWSPAKCTVSLNGTKIPTEVVSVFAYDYGATLSFSYETTIQGAVEEIEITDLDAPVHECELDYSATASIGTVTGVRYEMFRKSVTEVRKGDTVSIGVTVKLPEGYSFAEGSYAVWNGQKSDYRIRTSTMETDEYIYVFPYEVGVFGDQAYINSGSVYFMGDAMLKVGARVPDSNYIGSDDAGIIYGEPVWTPAHETFESGQTYVVRIPVSLEKGYVWADDILTNNDFAIASKKAKLVAEETGTSGGKKSYSDKYYLTAAFLPEDINGQGDDKSSAEVDTPVGDYKLDYHDEICVGIVVSSSEEDFSFEVDAENASPDIRFRWYRCDSNGNILDNTVLGNGKALLIYGIKDEDMYKTFYYKCVADDNGNEQSLVFSCILLPEKKDLPFKDVNLGDTFYGNVWYVYSHTPQLMNGVSSDSFDPDGNLTRAAIVTVLYRLEGSPAMAASNEFYDVPAGQWYTNAVAWAVKNGITNGYGDGRFGSNDPITREQLAVFLYRYAKSRNIIVPAYGKLNQADASTIDSWALDAMKWAYSNDIIEEVDGRLAPIDNALRHMIATALTRFCVGYSM